jgi:hypothetical protein
MAFPQQQQTFSGGGSGGLPPGSPPDIMDLIAPQGGQQNSVIHQGKFDQFYPYMVLVRVF